MDRGARDGRSRYPGGTTSLAFGISEAGEVVGQSETAAGRSEAFLWTRGRGMRSLGTLHGLPSSFAMDVNSHQRVVGQSYSDEGSQPFLWTPTGGMQRLPSLGGGGEIAQELNKFGQIVGASNTSLMPRSGRRPRAPLQFAQQDSNR